MGGKTHGQDVGEHHEDVSDIDGCSNEGQSGGKRQ